VRCHRFATVTAAQKISFISNPRAGRPVFHLFIQFSIYFICSILMTNVNLNDVLFVDCLPRYIKSLCSVRSPIENQTQLERMKRESDEMSELNLLGSKLITYKKKKLVVSHAVNQVLQGY